LNSSPERGGGAQSVKEGSVNAVLIFDVLILASTAPSTGFAGPPPRSGEDL
jgi:hypothetical protein